MSWKDDLRKWKARLGKLAGWLDKLDDILEPAAAILAAAGLPQYAAAVTLIVGELRRVEKLKDLVPMTGETALEVASGLVVAKLGEDVDPVAELPTAKRAVQLVIDAAVAAAK